MSIYMRPQPAASQNQPLTVNPVLQRYSRAKFPPGIRVYTKSGAVAVCPQRDHRAICIYISDGLASEGYFRICCEFKCCLRIFLAYIFTEYLCRGVYAYRTLICRIAFLSQSQVKIEFAILMMLYKTLMLYVDQLFPAFSNS